MNARSFYMIRIGRFDEDPNTHSHNLTSFLLLFTLIYSSSHQKLLSGRHLCTTEYLLPFLRRGGKDYFYWNCWTMDARKALFRAKLREKKQDKRIDSPLVRYNEADQPVCRVCNLTLKSGSLWPAHQASHKHHEAIENLKASAAGKSSANISKSNPPNELHAPLSSSTVPADFFDKQETKRQKTDAKGEVSSSGTIPVNHTNESVKTNLVEAAKKVKRNIPDGFFESTAMEKIPINQLGNATEPLSSEEKLVKGTLPDDFFDGKTNNENKSRNLHSQVPKAFDGAEVKQAKGSLPEGFFDNKDADLRARGIEPVKVDVNDAYKEFEKDIQEDLQEVDDRLEEEEIDAAEMREEFESLEQKQYRERVEMVKKKLIEVKAVKHAKGKQPPAFMGKESSDESSSDSDNEEENFTVDWRAKHL